MKKKASVNFAATMVVSSLLLMGSIAVVLLTLFSTTPKDEQAYRDLELEANPSNSKIQNIPYTATQERKGVQKDILFSQGVERLQLRLFSEEADLVLDRGENATEMIEKMRQVKCCMQEELFYVLADGREVVKQADGRLLLRDGDPLNKDHWIGLDTEGLQPRQHVRYLEADSATYYYKNDLFVGDKVRIYRYTIPGHQLTTVFQRSRPSVEGTAEKVEFSPRGQGRNFIAYKLKASHTCLSTDGKAMYVEAGEVRYLGRKALLTEGVALEHQLGKITAKEMVLTLLPESKKLALETIEMSKDIKIAFKEGGQLSCSNALLSNADKTGKFWGDGQQDYVTYTESCRTKSRPEQSFPLVVKSRKMTLHLRQGYEADLAAGSEANKAQSSVERLEAEGDVTVDYNREFLAAADFGTYHRLALGESGRNAILGTIMLYAGDEDGICRVTNGNGDLINSSLIEIDIFKKLIEFIQPVGVLYSFGGDNRQNERIEFSSKALLWDAKRDELTLLDHVKVKQKGFGSLAADDMVKISYRGINGKKQLQKIHCTGKTILTRKEENREGSHTLTCYGTLDVDHVGLEIHMASSLTKEGGNEQRDQVYFQDPKGEIYADSVAIKYEIADRMIAPQKLVLEGHVRILNTYAAGMETNTALVQYALADQVEYFPKEKEMFFRAAKGNRVLFYDKANDLQVSASALKINRNQATKKESIKGIGDVRFSFIDREFEQLRQRFSLDTVKKAPKEP